MTKEQIREKFKGAYMAYYDKAKKNSHGQYMSHRFDEDIILVCQDLNVLTVEDYCKWYGLYYLMEDPDTKEVMLVTLTFGDIITGVDHDYFPDSIVEFCIKNDLKLDGASYLCICKMLLDDNMYDDLKCTLPDVNDLAMVLKRNKESISHTFHVCNYDNPIFYSVQKR